MAQDKPTVLYVDDLPMNLKLFEAAFRKDYDIILTESPKEALKVLEEKEVQVLVSDQRMPEMIGTELLEIVAEKYPDVRRYLLTAYTDTETVIEAVNVGRVHGYIKKPMNAEEVRTSISNSLESYYLRKKNRQILQELEDANTELRNVDGLKSEIINYISNEISHPLNRIMGTLHLLKTKIEGDELSEVVNILDQSVFKLEQFSLLAKQISIMKSPGFELKIQKVSLKQVIQFGAIETREELKEKGIELERRLDDGEKEVEGDSGFLVSCLVNLIQFAKEHTEKNGQILVEILNGEKKLTIQVKDQGMNYSETLVELMTGQFNGEKLPLNLALGIGLAVCQMIMEAHGGQLVFERGNAGKGILKMVFNHE
jgi:signal transduction histidine kinase